MNWEFIKPLPGTAGISQPFFRVDEKTNRIHFSKTARRLLGIDGGGWLQVAKDRASNAYYIVPQKDGRATNVFKVGKNGTMSDLVLPGKLAVYAGLKKGEGGRVFISPDPLSEGGTVFYKVLRD